MGENHKESMVIIATHGCDDAERATFPFVMANAALVMESEVTVVLQGPAVLLAKKGSYEHVYAGGLEPLGKLVDSFMELGGNLWICTPCIKERKINQDMLVHGAEPVTAGRVVQACLDADATLNY